MAVRQGPDANSGVAGVIADNAAEPTDFSAGFSAAREFAAEAIVDTARKVERIRPMLNGVLASLGFEPASAPGLPENFVLLHSERYNLVGVLVDSLEGVAASGETSVASAGFTVFRGKLHGLIAFAAPTEATLVEAARGAIQDGNASALDGLRRLEAYGDAAKLIEAIQHELVHVEDLNAKKNFALTLYTAKLWDLVEAGNLPEKYRPSAKPSRQDVQAASLLFELHAFTENSLSSPTAAAVAKEVVGAIGEALKIEDTRERIYAVYRALQPWYAAIPTSYDVGDQKSVMLAALMAVEQETFP